MKLVNETNHNHFKSHIFYQGLTYDSSCNLDSFVENQYSHSEMRAMNLFFAALIFTASFAAILDWRAVLSWKYIFVLFASYNMVQLHHVFSHFGQDITFFNGNLLHHADVSKYIDKSNASFVDTVPQGFAFYIIVTVTWACAIRAFLPCFDPELSRVSWRAIFASTMICGMVLQQQVKYWHPWFHEVDVDQLASAWPFTTEFLAYKHITGHHTTGEWFGPHPIFDPLFAVVLRGYAYFHNTVFHLEIETAPHYCFAIFADSMVSMLYVYIVWVMMYMLDKTLALFEQRNDTQFQKVKIN